MPEQYFCMTGIPHMRPCGDAITVDGELIPEDCACGCSMGVFWCMTKQRLLELADLAEDGNVMWAAWQLREWANSI